MVHRVIAREGPAVRVVDLTHRIRAHDVRAGALALWRCAPWLRDSVVLAVVDPGVGTARRAVALETTGAAAVLVGPDNGLLTPAAGALGGVAHAVELAPLPRAVAGLGATFDGRDLFAPVAARIASGEWSLADAGKAIDPAGLVGDALRMASPGSGGEMVCEVLWVDRFGNAQLNTHGDGVDDHVIVQAGTRDFEARRVDAFGELGQGELGLVNDSYGLLALAFNSSPAAAELGLTEGDTVVLRSGVAR